MVSALRGLAAVAAEAGNLQPVACRDEAVAAGDLIEPGPELAVHELDDTVAVRADEVVVVPLGAPAIAELAGVVRDRVDDALLCQEA